MARYALHFDAEALTARGIALGEFTGDAIGKAIVTALNEVVGEAYDLSRKRMIDGINLTDAYLRRKMVLSDATSAKPQASITAVGTDTQLSQFQPLQHVTDVNWSNARITGMGKKFGKWPGWTRRTGNSAIGIAENKKADGQSAAIRRGNRAKFEHAFSIGGKKDNDGNLLMFTRKAGGDKTRVLLGPAVYQLFKYQLNGTLMGDAEDRLAESLAAHVRAAMAEALTK